jgi:hypothetical protein
MKILPSITTTGLAPFFSDWRKKIIKAKELDLKDIGFFPTCLDKKERKEAYDLFEKTGINHISFVHLRTDMDFKEIEYLIKTFNVEVFNIHSQFEYSSHLYDYSKSKHKNLVFVENVYRPINEEEINKFGGICLDFAHLENDRLLDNEKFNHNIKIIEKSKIGCNHVSAVYKKTHIDTRGKIRHDRHFLENFSELDYLKNYPINYFSDVVAIELENGLEEQLKMIDYINDLLKK